MGWNRGHNIDLLAGRLDTEKWQSQTSSSYCVPCYCAVNSFYSCRGCFMHTSVADDRGWWRRPPLLSASSTVGVSGGQLTCNIKIFSLSAHSCLSVHILCSQASLYRSCWTCLSRPPWTKGALEQKFIFSLQPQTACPWTKLPHFLSPSVGHEGPMCGHRCEQWWWHGGLNYLLVQLHGTPCTLPNSDAQIYLWWIISGPTRVLREHNSWQTFLAVPSFDVLGLSSLSLMECIKVAWFSCAFKMAWNSLLQMA